MTSDQQPIKSSYHTDIEIGKDEEDALNFSDFRPALQEILTEADTPLTVGIFGDWGSGKTSLMSLTKAALAKENEEKDNRRKGTSLIDRLPFAKILAGRNKKEGNVHCIWINVWELSSQDEVWQAFLQALFSEVHGQLSRRERVDWRKLRNQVLVSLGRFFLVAAPLFIAWWIGSSATELEQLAADAIAAGGVAASVGLLLLTAARIGPIVEAFRQTWKIDLKGAMKYAHYDEQISELRRMQKRFEKLVELLVGSKGRLVVFIDDLDRCNPDTVPEVLEAIKLFTTTERCVYLIGLDHDIVRHGIQARYNFPTTAAATDYLKKIVQIPFYLPSLAVTDLEHFIARLDRSQQVEQPDRNQGEDRSEPNARKMTREVFARGLFPNPRQVKRALNIFHLLEKIARIREDKGGLKPGSIAWPLLAKTVVIQSQFPELYRDWRQYPILVQILEEEYARQPSHEEDVYRGRTQLAPEALKTGEEAPVEKPEEPAGGLLVPYLEDRQKYTLLERMLSYPAEAGTAEGRERAHFAGLSRADMAAYVRLAGTVEAKLEDMQQAGTVETELEEAPLADLLDFLLSGDRVKIEDAAGRLDDQEEEKDGPQHRTIRSNLVRAIDQPRQPVYARVSAGNALARLGDPRFRADAWFLPGEDLLGFVEIPAGPFLMGSDKDKDPTADDDELSQHEVDLPAYYMARTPVTVAQFRAFVETSGHEPDNASSLSGLDNHPVVYVSWHDAMAYCDWLTEQLREWQGTPEPLATRLRHEDQPWRVILPSEAEWEKAARGDDGRIYPWGNKFDPELANTEESGVGGTSAVGCFPGGAGTHGLLDMSGNVWEWTRSLWGEETEAEYKYPYQGDDGRENLDASDRARRVIRGGSFYNDAKAGRCSFRFRYRPDHFGWYYLGFRLAASPFFTSGL